MPFHHLQVDILFCLLFSWSRLREDDALPISAVCLYETEKSKADQKKTIGLQWLHTIPRRVTFLHDDRINFNIHKNVFIHLYVDPTSETWFLNKYVEAEINKKIEKTRGQLASDEMEN